MSKEENENTFVLTKEQQAFLKATNVEVGKVLIATMDMLEIPNFIKCDFELNGVEYSLMFSKKPNPNA